MNTEVGSWTLCEVEVEVHKEVFENKEKFTDNSEETGSKKHEYFTDIPLVAEDLGPQVSTVHCWDLYSQNL